MAIRYRNSGEPIVTDGRDIDVQIGSLTGEAASQRASGSGDEHLAQMSGTFRRIPAAQQSGDTYYDRPLLQEPIWEWAIPTYYYVGGLTGATLAIGAAAQLISPSLNRSLVPACRLTGLVGASVSGGLLIYDLGRPERFFNMLRVFRPTSPMNMGAWILSATGGSAALAVILPKNCAGAKTSGFVAGIFGAALATYTGVLVANTAVPLWSEGRRVLPILFGASAVASAGCFLECLPLAGKRSAILKTFGIIGQVAEIVATLVLEQQVSRVPRVAQPLRGGLSGFLWRMSAVLTASSVLLKVAGSPGRRRNISANVLGSAGPLLMRFAIEHAGVISSRDARASFELQRR